MSEPSYRTIRIALQLGSERRVAEIEIRADSIPSECWKLQPDGTYRHAALEALAHAWALDQLEIRAFTPDGQAPHLHHVRQPGDSTEQPVQRATERTWTPRAADEPEQLCQRCYEELEEQPEPWQQPADAWRHK